VLRSAQSFVAYLTTFLIESRYKEPIKTVEKMLASDIKFGFFQSYGAFFTDSSDSTDSTILKNAVRCPIYDICLKWTIDYHKISTILSGFTKVLRNAAGM